MRGGHLGCVSEETTKIWRVAGVGGRASGGCELDVVCCDDAMVLTVLVLVVLDVGGGSGGGGGGGGAGGAGSSSGGGGALSAGLPPSPGSGDPFDNDIQGRKRQRTSGGPSGDDGGVSGKKGGGSRARSDSAPLGYQLAGVWPQTRPRSGSGLQSRVTAGGRRDELPVPNIASVSRAHHGLPTLSIPGGIIKQPPSAN